MEVSQAWYDGCFAVAPGDPNVVCWGAIELYRGTRGSGKLDWSKISSRKTGDSIHPDQHHIEFDPVDPRTMYVCNDGGLFRSPDRGATWADQAFEIPGNSLEVKLDPKASEHLVKVVTTDGTRSAEAIIRLLTAAPGK
jgi:hypothetical protein